jgi:hypothetical protein
MAKKCSKSAQNLKIVLKKCSGGARPQNFFGGGAFEGQTHILGGMIEFLKRYCYLPMPLSQDFCPPQEIRPPLKMGRYS